MKSYDELEAVIDVPENLCTNDPSLCESLIIGKGFGVEQYEKYRRTPCNF